MSEKRDVTALPLYDRLKAIAARELDDRTITPGEAAYIVKVLGEGCTCDAKHGAESWEHAALCPCWTPYKALPLGGSS